MNPLTTYVSLGKGNRLLSEDYYLAQFHNLGITKRIFRKWCRSMGVPLIFFPKNRVFVDLYTFKIALRGISRIGRPDFHLPTTEKWLKNEKRYEGPSTLDPAYMEANWKAIVSELVAARLEPDSPLRSQIQKIATEAAQAILAGRPAALIQSEQERCSARATKFAESEGVFKEFSNA